MEVLEPGQVVAGNDQVHALLVLDLVVAHRHAVGTEDLEAQHGAPAGLQVGCGELEGHPVAGREETAHRVGRALPAVSAGEVLPAVVLFAPVERFRNEHRGPKDERHSGDDPDEPGRRTTVDPGLVNHRVPLPAGDQIAVHRYCDSSGDHEGERKAAPEQQVAKAGVHRPRDHYEDEVVDDLHRGDAERVGGQRDRNHRSKGQPGPQERQAGKAVAEHECQGDGQDDRRQVRKAESGPDRHAGDLPERTAGQAVQGRADGHARERSTRGRHLVVMVCVGCRFHREGDRTIPPGGTDDMSAVDTGLAGLFDRHR